jgi:hypothetical protein
VDGTFPKARSVASSTLVPSGEEIVIRKKEARAVAVHGTEE